MNIALTLRVVVNCDTLALMRSAILLLAMLHYVFGLRLP